MREGTAANGDERETEEMEIAQETEEMEVDNIQAEEGRGESTVAERGESTAAERGESTATERGERGIDTEDGDETE